MSHECPPTKPQTRIQLIHGQEDKSRPQTFKYVTYEYLGGAEEERQQPLKVYINDKLQ